MYLTLNFISFSRAFYSSEGCALQWKHKLGLVAFFNCHCRKIIFHCATEQKASTITMKLTNNFHYFLFFTFSYLSRTILQTAIKQSLFLLQILTVFKEKSFSIYHSSVKGGKFVQSFVNELLKIDADIYCWKGKIWRTMHINLYRLKNVFKWKIWKVNLLLIILLESQSFQVKDQWLSWYLPISKSLYKECYVILYHVACKGFRNFFPSSQNSHILP